MRYLLILTLFSTTLSAQLIGDTETGLASYYSREYHSAETAYDLKYDRNELVAAHRSWPVNSTIEVKNLDNGRSVRVRVIDKGPFIRGRVIEVSERAASAIGLLGKVTVPVEITLRSIGGPGGTPVARSTYAPPPRPVSVPAEPAVAVKRAPAPQPRFTPAPRPTTYASKAAPTAPAPSSVAAPAPAQEQTILTQKDPFAPGVYRLDIQPAPTGDFAVQVGSFRDLEGAMTRAATLRTKWFDDVLLERESVQTGTLYKVLLGPFPTEDRARIFENNLKKTYGLDGFVVRISGY